MLHPLGKVRRNFLEEMTSVETSGYIGVVSQVRGTLSVQGPERKCTRSPYTEPAPKFTVARGERPGDGQCVQGEAQGKTVREL